MYLSGTANFCVDQYARKIPTLFVVALLQQHNTKIMLAVAPGRRSALSHNVPRQRRMGGGGGKAELNSPGPCDRILCWTRRRRSRARCACSLPGPSRCHHGIPGYPGLVCTPGCWSVLASPPAPQMHKDRAHCRRCGRKLLSASWSGTSCRGRRT